MPAFSLPPRPAVLAVCLHLLRNAPLPPASGRYPRRTRGFGGQLEPRYIFGAASLDQWAITHSFKDGCFWANLLAVWAMPLPFPL